MVDYGNVEFKNKTVEKIFEAIMLIVFFGTLILSIIGTLVGLYTIHIGENVEIYQIIAFVILMLHIINWVYWRIYGRYCAL